MSTESDPLTGLHEVALEAYRSHFPVAASDKRLRQLIEDTLATPGNLVRLKLGLITGETLGLTPAARTKLSTSFEYFHTASLLLDDLPCMDDAAQRRGKPCAHRVHGEAVAIMGAMAFINRAYALAWSALASVPAFQRESAANHLERCLGESGILDGQCQDLGFAESDRSARQVARVALGKTAALLRLVLVTPALLANAPIQERLLLSRLAVYWGLAYQIADDWSDVASGRTQAKTPGRDAALGRPNYLLAAGAVATLRRLEHLLTLTSSTVDRLVAIRPGWECLKVLVTRLVRSAEAVSHPERPAGLRCA